MATSCVAIPPAPILPGIGVLTDAAWSVIEALLPVRRSRIGRPNIDHRHVLEGMIVAMQLGVSWRSLPASFDPWQTVYDRYAQWVKQAIWMHIVPTLSIAGSDNS
jgi:transposase